MGNSADTERPAAAEETVPDTHMGVAQATGHPDNGVAASAESQRRGKVVYQPEPAAANSHVPLAALGGSWAGYATPVSSVLAGASSGSTRSTSTVTESEGNSPNGGSPKIPTSPASYSDTPRQAGFDTASADCDTAAQSAETVGEPSAPSAAHSEHPTSFTTRLVDGSLSSRILTKLLAGKSASAYSGNVEAVGAAAFRASSAHTAAPDQPMNETANPRPMSGALHWRNGDRCLAQSQRDYEWRRATVLQCQYQATSADMARIKTALTTPAPESDDPHDLEADDATRDVTNEARQALATWTGWTEWQVLVQYDQPKNNATGPDAQEWLPPWALRPLELADAARSSHLAGQQRIDASVAALTNP